MPVINQIKSIFLGLPTLGSPYTMAGLAFISLLALFAFAVSLSDTDGTQRIDRKLFWIFGIFLVVFAILRPIGLARDDFSYVEIVKSLCAQPECSDKLTPTRDYFWYYLVKLGLSYWPGRIEVALMLSGLGVLIKLFVMDRLCSKRLLALLLFIPLCYLQFDLTQLRAGLAISWMMLGLYFLAKSKLILGGVVLFTNLAFHSQAVFSPGLLTYKLLGINRWVVPVGIAVLLGMLYSGVSPTVEMLEWLHIFKFIPNYYEELKSGAYIGVKVFPLGYLLMLAYGLWLCGTAPDGDKKIVEIASVSLFLGVAIAWFFSIVPIMQTRVFEFYAVPLVLLAGNVAISRLKIAATVVLALVLYLRLELLNDWILG